MTELSFKGKEFVYNHHLSVPFRPLVPDAAKGIGPVDPNGNLIIQGDNLHALKALLPMYAGKVDCIFIDPPYNTGNEGWAYNDNVNAPMIKEWLAANPIGIEDGLRHDKWCAMMWPRLRLLHELLSEYGSFWMTLDDNEIHRGRALLDGVFGEGNFIGCICWEKTYTPKSNSRVISADHDYVLIYAKTKSIFIEDGWNLLEKDEQQKARYTDDGDSRGPWRTFPLDVRKERTIGIQSHCRLGGQFDPQTGATGPCRRRNSTPSARLVASTSGSQAMLRQQLRHTCGRVGRA